MSDTTSTTTLGPSHLKLLDEFTTLESGVLNERAERIANSKKLLSFGVPFLDESLGGIEVDDLILIASKTGHGKTQLATYIALNNIKRGKTVHFFALVSAKYEIERRLKYQIIADRFFKMNQRPQIYLNYMDWYQCKLDEYLIDLEKEAELELTQYKYKKLFIYYRNKDFTARDFQRLVLGVKSQTDLIIADHLHYFDFEDENENRALKDTVKSIRDSALLSGKPVILVSHVRKSDRRTKQLVPDIEDLHGSSDIGKIGTKVITLGPCYEESQGNHRKTYFHIGKCRVDGSRDEMTGLLAFNFSTQNYERQYFVGKLSGDGSSLNLFNLNQIPYWAINAKAFETVKNIKESYIRERKSYASKNT